MLDCYMGLDLSLTDSGIAVMQNGKLLMSEVKTSPHEFEHSIARAEHIADFIMKQIVEFSPCLIVVEDYFMGKNAKAIINLCELGTIVRYKILKAGFSFRTVAPNQLKKFCLGNGSAGKELILKGVYKKWNVDVDNNNIADAVVLAYMSKAIYCAEKGIPNELMKYEDEVVKKIIKDRKLILDSSEGEK